MWWSRASSARGAVYWVRFVVGRARPVLLGVPWSGTPAGAFRSRARFGEPCRDMLGRAERSCQRSRQGFGVYLSSRGRRARRAEPMSDRVAQQRVLAEIDPVALVDLASALIRIPSFQDRGDAGGAVPRPVLPRARLPRRASRDRARTVADDRNTAREGGGASLMLNGHTDINALTRRWRRDPWTPVLVVTPPTKDVRKRPPSRFSPNPWPGPAGEPFPTGNWSRPPA